MPAQPTVRTVLDAVATKQRLFEVARHFGVAVPTKGTRAELANALSRSDEDDDAYGVDDEELDEEDAAEVAGATTLLKSPEGLARDLLEKMLELARQNRHRLDGKTARLIEWIRSNLLDGKRWQPHRVIVFTEYGDTMRYLQRMLGQALEETHLGDERIAVFHGGMGDASREELQEAFNGDPAECPVRVLIATDAAREGLNLQNHCADLFHFDVPWNPARMEQRNGRIDRTLQPAKVVRCHYFVYPCRAEDAVLGKLVEKVDTIRRELGSLGEVVMVRIEKAFERGIDSGTLDDIDRAEELPEQAETTLQELESQRADVKALKKDIDDARRILNRSRAVMDYREELLRDAVDVGLELAGAERLKAVGEAVEGQVAYQLPKLPASWDRTLDTLRRRRRRDEPEWEWRKEPPQPVVFKALDRIGESRVHLHLGHPFVQRILSRFLSQGFGAQDLSRVTIVPEAKTGDPRAIAFGRLPLFGPGAALLHDELIVVSAPWRETGAEDHLVPSGDEEDAVLIERLEQSLVNALELAPVPQALERRLAQSAASDFSTLWPHVRDEADGHAHQALQLLAARGDKEAEDLRKILRAQRAAIEKQLSRQLDVASLDKPETATGTWEYPAQAKFERLLRECRVPIGLLSNGWEIRLVYAPHGESSGWIAFRVDDMASVSGRPIFDAYVMLLSRQRWFGVAKEQQLPAILAESRKRNADVTNELSRQVFEALEVLLAGFAAADERDGSDLLRQAIEREDEHLYAGLLAVLLRMVFLLYCEDRALLPVEHPLFSKHYSLLGLFDQLQEDNGKYPDTMHRRFGAYPGLVSLFRAVFLGVKHGDLDVPARRGELFDPNTYPLLEGWGPEGSAPIMQAEDRAAVRVPSVDDLTVFTVLHKLLYLDGQRLSYKALDVEQIGSVYEALMGFDVQRLSSAAVRIRLGSKKGAARVWVEAEPLLAVPKAQRQRWLQDELGFDKGVAEKIAKAVASVKAAEEALAALEPLSGRRPERAAAGTLVIQPGPERRRTSSHYTPRELTEPIVARTLEPLIKAIGAEPASETLLNLVICDPAMGSGAFLVAACRYLADHVVAAWTREGKLELVADAHEDVVNHARRLVAQRCLYGVDKNRYAVQLARLSLWLVTMARDEPFTFVDHALRHGDSLVGLSFEQIKGFHWKPGKQVELSAKLLEEALDEAIGIRQRIQELAGDGTWTAQREKERLLFDSEDALDRVRLIGDLVIGAFFAEAKDKARQQERDRRLDLVEQWLAADKAGDGERAAEFEAGLRGLQAELKKTQVPFHWMVEFPEVFYAERPDPLDGGRRNGAAWVDGFVGNPPFSGKNGISTAGGPCYIDWLMAARPEVVGHPNTDLCAYFFRRGADLLGANGTIGLVATNTIAEGDSRLIGLKPILAKGTIFDASTDMSWPGDAAVTVSVVHFALGKLQTVGLDKRVNGRSVNAIDSRLRAGIDRDEQVRLRSNGGISYMGGKLVGVGLAVSLDEHRRLVAADPSDAQILRPYLGGEEVNSNVLGRFDRYVIDFTDYSLEEAGRWPLLLRIAEEKVRPAREHDKRGTYKTYWWRPGESGGALYAALQGLSKCLVTARVTKHLMFSFQEASIFFSEALYVFALDGYSPFAVLQSRIHEPWARLLSSSMKTDLRYAASDCFETFPFPQPDPRTVIPELEAIGERLYETRARFMVDTDQGLTKTYNALKDPSCVDPRILELRRLHEDMDRAVLAAYGWSDLNVPPYCPTTDAERSAVKAFEDAVIDRLFELNAQRAKEEQKSLGDGQAGKGRTSKKSKPKAAGKKRGSSGAVESGQLDLLSKREPGDG